MSILDYWLWLSASPLGPRARQALLDTFGDAERVYFATKEALDRVPGLSRADAEALQERDLKCAQEIREACRQQNIRIITLQDAAYPNRLRHICAPPVVLYVKGRLPEVDDNALISVIGTRRASVYGLRMARDMAWQISRCGGIVVSGLTTGIDAAAAESALRAGSPCVGVLGTAHESERSELARWTAEQGALISEYPPGTVWRRSFFRDRNRIAAGLSVGVVVIEAPEKSGTQLFVAEATEQGKEIFAVPGNADAENSAGTLAMLKEGAMLATCGWDVLQDFEPLFPGKLHNAGSDSPPEPRPAPAEEPSEPGTPAAAADQREQKAVDKPQRGGYIDLSEQLSTLTETQLKIVTAIDREASHIDDIVEATGLPAHVVLGQLTLLEIRGVVRRQAGMRIVLNTAKK